MHPQAHLVSRCRPSRTSGSARAVEFLPHRETDWFLTSRHQFLGPLKIKGLQRHRSGRGWAGSRRKGPARSRGARKVVRAVLDMATRSGRTRQRVAESIPRGSAPENGVHSVTVFVLCSVREIGGPHHVRLVRHETLHFHLHWTRRQIFGQW